MYKIIDSENKDDIFDRLKYITHTIFDDITLCTKNNSVDNGNVIQIKYKEPEALPICSIDVLTKKFTIWTYKTQSGNYNLLSSVVRASLKNRFSDFCGKLLDGNTTSMDPVYFYKTKVENTADLSADFKTVINNISILNSRVNSSNESEMNKELKKRGTNTKGVYYTGDKTIAGGLIELLDSKYSVNNIQHLTIGNSNLADANVYITGNKNGIVFANVNTETYVKL